jgi:hypothetical protein
MVVTNKMARIKASGRYAGVGIAEPKKFHNISIDSSTVHRTSLFLSSLVSFYNITDFP